MQITKQNDQYAIIELSEEQVELIQAACAILAEEQQKDTPQSLFLRRVGLDIDKQLPNLINEDNETNKI